MPWLLLFRNGVLSRQQQATASTQSSAFLSQVNTYPRNAAARQFDRLGAHLGFDPNDLRGLSFKVDTQAALAYRTIESDLTQFIQHQAAKTSGPLSPLPPNLSTYLQNAKPKLAAIQTHLLKNDLPAWEIDIEQMSNQNYPFPGLVNTANVQKLLLLSAIEAQEIGDADEMLAALQASWRLNQAVALRPDLTAQLSASVISGYQAGLVRHLNYVPPQWNTPKTTPGQPQLAQQPSILAGLEFDIWLQYTTLQKMFAATAQGVSTGLDDATQTPAKAVKASPIEQLTGVLSYWFSPVHYFTLTNIDTAQTAHRTIAQLQNLTVCKTTQQEAHQLLAKQKTARWNNAIAPVPSVLTRRWKTAGDRTLAQELTQQVLRAKRQAKASGQWPASLPKKASEACPGEYWIYERTTAGTITISLSNQYSSGQYANAHTTTAPAIPLQYRATNKALNTATR